MNFLILLLHLLLPLANAKSYSKAKDAVLLSTVRTLTLHGENKLTTSRRVTPIPQLTCIGGNAKGLYNVDLMRCTNSGSEYDPEDIQWTCKANLPPEFKLGSTEVVCEGFDDAEDAYVLKGSCGVEYRLVLTEAGEEKFGRPGWFNSRQKESKSAGSDEKDVGGSLFAVLFWCAFIGMFLTNYCIRSDDRHDGTLLKDHANPQLFRHHPLHDLLSLPNPRSKHTTTSSPSRS